MAVVCTLGLIGVIALKSVIVSLFLAESYRSAAGLLLPIALGNSFFALSQVSERFLHGQERTDLCLVSRTIGAGMSLVAGVPMIYLYGIQGAAWAVPIYYGCQLATAMFIVRRIESLAAKRPLIAGEVRAMNTHRIQRVLIHRLGSLGDTLVALPAFRLVRETFPEARITVLTNHAQSDHAKSVGMAAILDGAGLVDDYLYYPVALRKPRELFRLRNRIARERYDIVIYLSSPGSTIKKVIRDALFFLGCGIRCQYGFPYTRRGRVNERLAGTIVPERKRSTRFQPQATRSGRLAGRPVVGPWPEHGRPHPSGRRCLQAQSMMPIFLL